jgi:huntingtin-interacting protein 1-related protein
MLIVTVDSVLLSGVQRVDESLYELDSSMQAGNQSSTPAYLLSQVEKASSNATEFATAFNNYIADGPNSSQADIIRTVHVFAGSISEVLSNSKGIIRLAVDDKKADALIKAARESALSTVKFFSGLQSFRLEHLNPEQKTDHVISANNEVQINLQKLSKLSDAIAPNRSKITNASGDIGDLVDREMTAAAKAIEDATDRLQKMMNKPRDSYSTYELKIHE